MKWDKEPTLKEFVTIFDDYVKEIDCMNNEDGYISAHKIVGRIRIEDDSDDESEYEIVGLDIGQLMGCGCWADIVIRVKRGES